MATSGTSIQEFAAVRGRLEELAGAVVEQSRTLKGAFNMPHAKRDVVLAQIIERDSHVDTLELSLDDMTLAFMNFRAPLGKDLRYALGAIDIAAGLERIGDCVEYVARNLREISATADAIPAAWAVLREMSEKTNMLLEKSVGAMVASDAKTAESIPALDNLVDALQDQAHDLVLKNLRATGDDQRGVAKMDPETGLTLVACANKFESIGDIACHIAETVVFVVQGRRIRHGASELGGVAGKPSQTREQDGNET
ncbi:MAG: phosphate signaling complex protein PhoU [Pseudomonadota bacterium]